MRVGLRFRADKMQIDWRIYTPFGFLQVTEPVEVFLSSQSEIGVFVESVREQLKNGVGKDLEMDPQKAVEEVEEILKEKREGQGNGQS